MDRLHEGQYDVALLLQGAYFNYPCKVCLAATKKVLVIIMNMKYIRFTLEEFQSQPLEREKRFLAGKSESTHR